MSLDRVPAGADVPNDCNVVIEIPMHGEPIKYEVDKETGAVFVDRFMSTSMHYPCNYGFIPQTLSDDGDPCDVLVLSPVALITGVVVRCRQIAHFFEHYKDLEPGKWVRLAGWTGPDEAKREVVDSVNRFRVAAQRGKT